MTWGDADTVAEIERLRAENAKLRAALVMVCGRLRHERLFDDLCDAIDAALNEETK